MHKKQNETSVLEIAKLRLVFRFEISIEDRNKTTLLEHHRTTVNRDNQNQVERASPRRATEREQEERVPDQRHERQRQQPSVRVRVVARTNRHKQLPIGREKNERKIQSCQNKHTQQQRLVVSAYDETQSCAENSIECGNACSSMLSLFVFP
jgi:hypothetical protein